MLRIDSLIAWCEEEYTRLDRELALLESKSLRTSERRGAAIVDTTDETTERVRLRLAELEDLLNRDSPEGETLPED